MADKNALGKDDNNRLWHLTKLVEDAARTEQTERLKLDRQTIAVQRAATTVASCQADVNEHKAALQRRYGIGSNDQITREGKIVRAPQ